MMRELTVVGIVYATMTAFSAGFLMLHWWRNQDYLRPKDAYVEFRDRLKTHARKAIVWYESLPAVAARPPGGRRADRSGLAAVRCVRGVGRAARGRRGRRIAPPTSKEVALA